LLKSGVVRVVAPVELAMLGRFRVGKLRLGRFSGGSDDSDVVPDNPVVVVIDVVDGKLSDGNESGGMVGTDSGGNPGDVYDGMPAATGGIEVKVELGRVLAVTTGIAGVVNGLGVYDGTAPIEGSVDVGRVGVDNEGKPVAVIVGITLGTAPPGTVIVAWGKLGASVAVVGVIGAAAAASGTWTICPFGGAVSTAGCCGVASGVTPSTGIRCR